MTSTLEPAALQYELVSPPKPKPKSHEIKAAQARFYGALARGFDEFNAKSTRGLYFQSIDCEIATQLMQQQVAGRLLSIGAGTGFREVRIRELSGLNLQITCVDISAEMCDEASQRGLDVICSTLIDAAIPANAFDACIFLNAFEVLTDNTERLDYFAKINRCLRPGSLFFVDAMDIEDRNDSWAALVKQQFEAEKLGDFGYDLGDCFSRRTDQDEIVFAHYSSRIEMETLFSDSEFSISKLQYFSEETGGPCNARQGNMFYTAKKN